MDGVTMIRIVWTLASFAVFVAIVLWAYSGRARQEFERAARLPFDDEAGRVGPGGAQGSGR
jgi:cytochrome c oxidase cbb3-type subunit IV